MKKITLLLALGLLVGGGWWLWRYYFQFGAKSPLIAGQPIVVSEALPADQAATITDTSKEEDAAPFTVEPFTSGLSVPWSLVFTSPTRLLVTERPGRIRVVKNGQLKPEPIKTFPEVSTESEEGLMGMTLDPDYANNHYIYICVAYENGSKAADKVVRLTDHDGKLDEDFIVIDAIPAARFHAGCRIRFGADNKLYISTGDATDKKTAQDLTSLGGKILRINADGSIPSDNPFPNSPVYSYGHRNPQGFDWHPISGTLVETEHGPSGNDGPGGGDEVNIITKGQNYGWPLVSHTKTKTGTMAPLLVFTPAVAPASGMFYHGSVFPQLTNTFLFGLLKGEGIMQVVFDQQQPDKVLSYQKLLGVEVGRVRDIVEGPDGLIYFTTSNQDGRGKPRNGDDHIYRMVPKP